MLYNQAALETDPKNQRNNSQHNEKTSGIREAEERDEGRNAHIYMQVFQQVFSVWATEDSWTLLVLMYR